jgi:cytoskeleton protein RodZ
VAATDPSVAIDSLDRAGREEDDADPVALAHDLHGSGVGVDAPALSSVEIAEAEVDEAPETVAVVEDEPRLSAMEVSEAAAATGPDRLALRVDGESWIEVYDDRGRLLVYALYAGDEPLQLRGWAPFDVFLGNAPVVAVEFEGQALQTDRFTRTDSTARFMVVERGAYPR